MRCQDFDRLDIARFDVTLRAREQTVLPPYLGSTLRGALGHALKDAACVVEHRDCRRCPLLDTCAYPYLFETPVPPEIKELRGQTHAPLPFLIEPPLVENPVRRVWRVPAANVMAAASSAASAVQSANSSQTKSPEANRCANAEGALDTRASVPQRQISTPASVVSSVVFPDRPRRFNIGDELRFGLVLIGKAIDYSPFFLHAINEMANRGLGAGRAGFDLKEVFLKGARGERERVYSSDDQGLSLPARIGEPLSESIAAKLAEQTSGDGGTPVLESIDQVIATTLSQLARPASDSVARAVDSHSSLTLRFLTPARIRVKDDLQTGLSFQLLVRSLLRRVSMLAAVHGSGRMQLDYRGLIEQAGSARVVRSTLRWWDLERYTDRQETKLRVGGLIGEVEYEGRVIDEFMPLICAGELLGVGTGTSLGLGRYQISAGEKRKV
ncbi:MAG: CRISPR system precrRNA processing endoribonuclease RAMP protein Cas6 [Acidobacteriota bacterium]